MSDVAKTGSTPAPIAAGAPERPEPEGEPTNWVRRGLTTAAIIAVGVWVSLPALIIILALIFMIFMHELGHYVTARAAGMKVTEFFLGFGPRLWSFHRGETEYGIKAIPAGAYVRILGMSNLEEIDPADEGRTYRQKSYWRRMSVAVAGSTMHFLMAIALFFVVVSVLGSPDPNSSRWTVAAVTDDSAASGAGLALGDRILAVDGERFDTFSAMSAYLRDRPGENVTLTVERGGRPLELSTTLGSTNNEGEAVGFLGVGPEFPTVRVNPVAGLAESVQATGETMWLSVSALGSFFSPDGLTGYVETLSGATPTLAPGEVEGQDRVISVVGAVQLASQSPNIAAAVYFLFAINIFLGVFNLVPLLPFDGGHVAIATYERIRSRKGRRHFADISKLMPVTYVVVALLAFIFVTSIYLDIVNPISFQ